jgi:hypothetical protein
LSLLEPEVELMDPVEDIQGEISIIGGNYMYKNIVLLLDLFLEHFDSCCLVAGVGVSSLEVAPYFMSYSLIFLGILSVCHSSCSLGDA